MIRQMAFSMHLRRIPFRKPIKWPRTKDRTRNKHTNLTIISSWMLLLWKANKRTAWCRPNAGYCLWPLNHFHATVYVYPEFQVERLPLPWWWTNVKSFFTRMCQCNADERVHIGFQNDAWHSLVKLKMNAYETIDSLIAYLAYSFGMYALHSITSSNRLAPNENANDDTKAKSTNIAWIDAEHMETIRCGPFEQWKCI